MIEGYRNYVRNYFSISEIGKKLFGKIPAERNLSQMVLIKDNIGCGIFASFDEFSNSHEIKISPSYLSYLWLISFHYVATYIHKISKIDVHFYDLDNESNFVRLAQLVCQTNKIDLPFAFSIIDTDFQIEQINDLIYCFVNILDKKIAEPITDLMIEKYAHGLFIQSLNYVMAHEVYHVIEEHSRKMIEKSKELEIEILKNRINMLNNLQNTSIDSKQEIKSLYSQIRFRENCAFNQSKLYEKDADDFAITTILSEISTDQRLAAKFGMLVPIAGDLLLTSKLFDTEHPNKDERLANIVQQISDNNNDNYQKLACLIINDRYRYTSLDKMVKFDFTEANGYSLAIEKLRHSREVQTEEFIVNSTDSNTLLFK